MNEPLRLYAVTAEADREDVGDILVQGHECDYVTETTTGLVFRDDTPIEVWSVLIGRLLTQHKRIEWALADAINFGERRYGEMYAQWVDETGLAKRTLQNIASIGRKIESSRRREDVSFSHHAEVAYLPVPDQEALLDAAEHAGMTRYELRDAVRARKKELSGEAVAADGTPVESGALAWAPDVDELVPEIRAALEARAPTGRLRFAFVQGAIWALIWSDQRDAFTSWGGPE